MAASDIYEPTDKNESVGTSAVTLSQEMTSSQREVWFVVNTSTGGQKITIGIGKDAVAGYGIVLEAGQGWAESVDAVFSPTNKRITAIASAAGGTVAFHERLMPKLTQKRWF